MKKFVKHLDEMWHKAQPEQKKAMLELAELMITYVPFAKFHLHETVDEWKKELGS